MIYLFSAPIFAATATGNINPPVAPDYYSGLVSDDGDTAVLFPKNSFSDSKSQPYQNNAAILLYKKTVFGDIYSINTDSICKMLLHYQIKPRLIQIKFSYFENDLAPH